MSRDRQRKNDQGPGAAEPQSDAEPATSRLQLMRSMQKATAARKIHRTPEAGAESKPAEDKDAEAKKQAEAQAINGKTPPLGPDGKPFDPAKDTEFGKPFTNKAEAEFTKAWLMTMFIPSVTAAFGTEVGKIWMSYLSRKPGDSLAPRRYGPGDEIGDAFIRNPLTHQVTQEVLYGAQEALVDPTVGPQFLAQLKSDEYVNYDLKNMVGGLDQFDLDYANPADIPGHLAGGQSGSDAGADTRSIKGDVAVKSKIEQNGEISALDIKPAFSFHVADAVDFLPGGPGAGIEQIFTVPLSRLEASGMAYDVPFVVDFPAPDTRIGAPLPEGNGREKHLQSVLEVAHTFKEKGFTEAAKLVGEKAKAAETGLLAKAAEKAKKLKADGGKTLANTADSAMDFVLNHLFGES